MTNVWAVVTAAGVGLAGLTVANHIYRSGKDIVTDDKEESNKKLAESMAYVYYGSAISLAISSVSFVAFIAKGPKDLAP